MLNQRISPVLMTTAGFGMMLWTVPFGSFHAYIVSIDWGALDSSLVKEAIRQIITTRSFVAISVIGLAMGLLAQSTAILGGALRSEGFTLLGPMCVGFFVGLFQGILVGSDLWGYTLAGLPLRSLTTRVIVGGVCGLLASPLVMVASVSTRRRLI